MASIANGSTVPRRQLGRKLRELRESCSLTVAQAVSALEWSKPRLWRYETGQVPIHPNDVGLMCQLYNADEALTLALKDLARQTKVRSWWQDFANMPEWFQLYLGLESVASRIRQYHNEVIPGLLQSPAYARQVINDDQLFDDLPEEVNEERVTLRRKRQEILTRRSPRAPELEFIMSEAALLRGFAADVMRDQLTRLLTLSELPNISIRIIPFSAGFTKAYHGPFLILDFPQETSARDPEPTTIYHEHLTGALYLDSPTDVRIYEELWADLDSMAATQIESRRLIGDIVERWSRGGSE